MTTKGIQPNIKTVIQANWVSDQAIGLEQRRQNYIKKNNTKPSSILSNKFNKNISLSEIKELSQEKVNVLLYEASTTLSEWSFLCQNCIVKDDQ